MKEESSEITPGSFRVGPPSEPLPQTPPITIEAEPRADLVAKYMLFKNALHPDAHVVYHPCGANDVSTSSAFPEARVIYVDIDDKSMDALRKKGFEAHTVSALEFDPGEVDVLIMLNPVISPDIPASHVKENGFVVSNDYHGTATGLREKKEYALRAIIRKKNRELIFDTENLGDYWREIETDEEFKNAPFDWGAAHYKTALNVVEAVTGKRANIIAEYKKIIEMAKAQERERNTRMVAEDPQMAAFVKDPDEKGIFTFHYGDKQFVLPATLPRKKGTVDDLFVFQKVRSVSI